MVVECAVPGQKTQRLAAAWKLSSDFQLKPLLSDMLKFPSIQ